MNDEQLDQSESEDVAGGVTFHASTTNNMPAFRVKCDAALPLKRSRYYYYYLEYFYLTAGLFLQRKSTEEQDSKVKKMYWPILNL